mmetsp:Transcript_52464/g.147260  ORF Transcript_52464/g.147260 Transcript_52464/m.147260 type:complete len:223 (-) Transcript_52464:457-1125(-)
MSAMSPVHSAGRKSSTAQSATLTAENCTTHAMEEMAFKMSTAHILGSGQSTAAEWIWKAAAITYVMCCTTSSAHKVMSAAVCSLAAGPSLSFWGVTLDQVRMGSLALSLWGGALDGASMGSLAFSSLRPMRSASPRRPSLQENAVSKSRPAAMCPSRPTAAMSGNCSAAESGCKVFVALQSRTTAWALITPTRVPMSAAQDHLLSLSFVPAAKEQLSAMMET